MIYPKDSFYTNFIGAYKSKDIAIMRDLVFSQIGLLISTQKKNVIETFKEVGVILPKKPSDSDIVDAIIKYSTNRRLHIGIAYLIHDMNKKQVGDSTNINGDKSTTDSSATTNATVNGGIGNPVSAIAEAIGGIFDYKVTTKSIAAQKSADRVAMLQNIDDYKTSGFAGETLSNFSGKSKKIYYIVGGTLLAIGIGLGIFLYVRHKRKIGLGLNANDTMKEAGGTVVAPNVLPNATPINSTPTINPTIETTDFNI